MQLAQQVARRAPGGPRRVCDVLCSGRRGGEPRRRQQCRPRAELRDAADHPDVHGSACVIHGGKQSQLGRARGRVQQPAHRGPAGGRGRQNGRHRQHGRRRCRQALAGDGPGRIQERGDALPPRPPARPPLRQLHGARAAEAGHRRPHRRRQVFAHWLPLPPHRGGGRPDPHRRRRRRQAAAAQAAREHGAHSTGPCTLYRQHPPQPQPLRPAFRRGAVGGAAARAPRARCGSVACRSRHAAACRRRRAALRRPAPAAGARTRRAQPIPGAGTRRGNRQRRRRDGRCDSAHDAH
mmetsp:Transcript_43947/g.131775  ORF Transcript_43947/g.131775 Transcript_43947/m.131775 type:complete len:294 (+) Transcript_43947:1507-2388(+)